MFGRFFLIILSVISLAWIVFIGYDLLDKKDQISPQNIFTTDDGEILIVNRSNEVQTDKLDFEFDPIMNPIFEKLMKNVFPNERFFVSSKRAIIIVELPRIWNENLLESYLKTKQIGQFLRGEFSLRFKKNYLMISSLPNVIAHEEEEWPLWDGKASASLIHLERPLKSTNVYFKSDGTVYYQTKYGQEINGPKIDDNESFAQFLPSELNEYHFYEREYALKNRIINEKGPLYQWLDEGFVLFEFENTPCMISDYNKTVDPMQMLLSDTDQNDTELTNHFTGKKLTTNFPKNVNKGFYIGKLGDKVVFSENKEVMEKVIANYQLGNTLTLNKEKLNAIFYKMPKKVSERLALSNEFFALSAYKNLLIRTEIYDAFKSKDSSKLIVKKDLSTTKINNTSFSCSQEPKYFLGNGNMVFSVGKVNELIALSNKKQIWKIQLDGEILGQVKMIDLNNSGKQSILINTRNKIYLINAQDGANVNEFPLLLTSQNSVSTYSWNNKTYFLVVNTNNELVQITDKGRVSKKIKVKGSDFMDEVSTYRKGSILTSIITSAKKTFALDIDRGRFVNTNILLPNKHIQLKGNDGFSFFRVDSDGLYRWTTEGQKSTILASKTITCFKKIYRGKEQLIAFQDKQVLYVIDANGNFVHKIKIAISDIDDFDIITATNGKTYIAVLEGIQNDIFVLNAQGNQVTDKSFEGKRLVKLSENQGKINLTSTLERNIIQHYDVLAK